MDHRVGGTARTAGRWLLAAFLAVAGVSHFTDPESFAAQVPDWMPWPDAVIAVSGMVELALAAGLVLPHRHRAAVGWATAAFFVVIFPGNISQFVTGSDAFGLDSDAARAARLLLQPVLIVWALWCTRAWQERPQRRTAED